MSLQALSHEDRIYFLVTFVEDMVTNSAENQRIRELIAVEKLKLKHLQDHKPFEALASVGFLNQPQTFASPVLVKEIPSVKQEKPSAPTPPESMPSQLIPEALLKKSLTPVPPDSMYPQMIHEVLLKKPLASVATFKKELTSPTNTSPPVSEDPLGKISHLIHDIGVQFIECPGAGKFVLVKVRNNINTTRITLSEDEIMRVIDHFSQQAQIPLIGGILKTAVGNMLISAVSSKYVGSRFLITKKSPYSLIEKSKT